VHLKNAEIKILSKITGKNLNFSKNNLLHRQQSGLVLAPVADALPVNVEFAMSSVD
jgi:hypothetical protein